MTDYREHYEKYLSIYEQLAEINGGKTVWIPTDDHDGWYVTESVDDESSDAWMDGYPTKSRPSILPDDLSPDVQRSAYTTISYALPESYEEKYFRQTDAGGIEWMNNDSSRLPDYGDIVAWSIFVDIDIKDEYKKRPLDEQHKEIIQNRLELWVQAYKKMAGGIEHVKILDSGGGMYVFIPPSSLAPVADRYDHEKRRIIFNEIGKRIRKITGKLNELICDDEYPDALFKADKVQNKNRQFKTIGSIHKDIDTVVHPVDPEDIEIEHLPQGSVKESDIDEAMQWTKDFVSDTHRECVSDVIKYIFQGDFTESDEMSIDYVEGDDWQDILDNWADEKLEEIRRWEESRQERDDLRDELVHVELTQDKEIAQESVRRVNNKKLKDYIIDFVGSSDVYPKNNNEMDFFPFWRSESTESGRSAFYDYYEGKARFTDKADGTSRGIVYWVALEMTYDDKNYPDVNMLDGPGDDLSGKQYAQCIQELRNRGEDIPLLVPEVGEDEELPNWQLINIGRDLDLISEDDIVEVSDKQRSLQPEAHNKVLNTLNNHDIVHNRELKTLITIADIEPPEYEASQMNPNIDKSTLMKDILAAMQIDDDDSFVFDSRDEYIEFINNVPEYTIPFRYEGEIKGPADGVLLGSFRKSDDINKIFLSDFEPFPRERITAITSPNDLTMQNINMVLDKHKIEFLVHPDQYFTL